LFTNAAKLGAGPKRAPVYFPTLDDPTVLYVAAPAKPKESAKEATARLEEFVAQTVEPKLKDDERASTQQIYGFFLGLVDLPDTQLAGNPYGVAFALGRREQLGIDSAKLKKAIGAVTDDDLRRVAKEVFAPNRHTGAFLTIKEK
jgi:zinc protease